MYQTPKLEKFGSFRDLTLQDPGNKDVIGDDLIPGIGLDCDSKLQPPDPYACRS